MNKYKNLATNTALFAANALATKLISFFLVPLYTTYLSAGEYGITDMSLTVISLLIPLVTIDISDATVRFIVGDYGHGERYAAISLSVGVASSLVVVLLTPLLDLDVFGGLGQFKGWFVLAYATSVLMSLCGNISRGKGDVRYIPICAAVSSSITLLSAIFFISSLHFGVTGYFISVSIGPLVAIALYCSIGGIASYVMRGYIELAKEGLSAVSDTIIPMIHYSLPLVPNALFWWVGTSINRLFITGMLGITASGMFAAAGKIPHLINTAYVVFQQAWQLSAFQEAGKKDIERFYSSVFRLVQAGLTVLCALLSLCSPWLASLMLRGDTYAAWTMIPVLLLANLMNVFNSFFATVYTSTMKTAYVMRTTVFGALSCTIFTPTLIPIFGTYGACIASVIGQGLVFVLIARDSKKYIRFDVGWRRLVPVLALLAAQAAVTAAQIPEWGLMSLVLTAAVVIVQGSSLLSFGKSVLRTIAR